MNTPPINAEAVLYNAAGSRIAHQSDRPTLVEQHSDWEQPAPLGGVGQLLGFPVDAMPCWLAEQVAAVAEFTQTPPDLAGCIALAALSTAAGGRAVVEVRGPWREPLNLYTAVAMHAGSRKSAVFALMTEPLMQAEQQLAEQGRVARVEAEQSRRLAEQRARRAEAAAAERDGERESVAAALDAALQAENQEIPAVPRLVADDVTAEAAASLPAEQGGRLAILSAEGGVFATMAGRYTNGAPNLEVLLKGHAGDMLRVDRKGRPAEHIAQPALTLGLAVQPDVLRDIARMPGFRGRGFARPHSVRRTEQHRWQPQDRAATGVRSDRHGLRRQPAHDGLLPGGLDRSRCTATHRRGEPARPRSGSRDRAAARARRPVRACGRLGIEVGRRDRSHRRAATSGGAPA